MTTYFAIGQRPTVVTKGPAGEIFISQWGYSEKDNSDRIAIDPIFVPTLIRWLQELMALEAVG